MKKVISLILALFMSLGCVVALGEIEIIPIETLDSMEVVIDPADPLDSQYHGMYSIVLTMEDASERTLYQYVPDSWFYRQPEVAIGVPADEDPVEFFISSGWKDLMDAQGFAALLMVAADRGWQPDESEYVDAVFGYMDGRKYLQTQDSAFYMVGYEDAANAVMAHALTNGCKYAGFAAFGVDEFDVSLLDAARVTPSLVPNLMNSQIAVPMWIGAAEKTDAVEALTQYWKEANSATQAPMSNPYADEIYTFPTHMMLDNDVTDQNIATVRVTYGLEDVATPGFTGQLWNDWLRRVRRQDNEEIGALRAFATNDELGMDHYTIQIDGVNREFYVFVPSDVKAGYVGNVPVLFAFHGGGGSGEEFACWSAWHRTAEERQFIVVYPTGHRGNDGIKASTSWSADDLEFFKQVRGFVLENYSADATRVYATGLSQGSVMTHNVALYCPELVAAVAPNDGTVAMNEMEGIVQDIVMPYLLNTGTEDQYFTPGSDSVIRLEASLEMMLGRYGIPYTYEDAYSYQNGRYFGHVWVNEQGIPVVQEQWVQDKGHSTIPEENYVLYDFLSKYSRGEDGTCYYMGKAIVMQGNN
ncbi:MAG: hypothetical protein Q4D04_14055 [Clostridia bacterium]|nr:hypothetical protein [Clostridia bacterium]